MANKSLSESSRKILIEVPVWACVVSLWDRLPVCCGKKQIVDNFAAATIKGLPDKSLCARRTISLLISMLLNVLLRTVNLSIWWTVLTSVSSYPWQVWAATLCLCLCKDLALLQVLVFKLASRSECFAEDIAGVLTTKVDAGIMSHLS